MATNREVEAAEKAADDMLEIDGIRVHPADKERFMAVKKAQEEAEKAAEESAPRTKARSNTANKARTETDNK